MVWITKSLRKTLLDKILETGFWQSSLYIDPSVLFCNVHETVPVMQCLHPGLDDNLPEVRSSHHENKVIRPCIRHHSSHRHHRRRGRRRPPPAAAL